MEILNSKQCSKCLVFKEVIEYGKHSGYPDGLHSICNECEKIRKANSYLINKARYNENSKKWYLNNKDRNKELGKKWANNNREKERARAKKFREENIELSRERVKKSHKRNPENRRAARARRRAAESNSLLDYHIFKDEIIEIYKNRPEGYHVDHIIPLQGKNVCGLHVPWNLQYLPAHDNIKKGNKCE